MQFRPVSATSDIASPYDGQIVYNLTDGKPYVYKASASAWWTLSGYARYALTGISTVNLVGGTDTLMQFPTAVKTDPRVTPNGSFNAFTLAAGIWTIEASMRLNGNSDIGFYLATGTTASEGTAFASGSVTDFINVGVSDTIELTSATSIVCFAWAGTTRNAVAQGDDVTHITFRQTL
jgi:hypothetical protein